MLLYRLLADGVLIVHFTIVLFVIFGLLATVMGLVLRWRWVRNFWYRMVHLAAIGVVVVQAWCGAICPLTTLENYFRSKGGEATYAGSFITYWLHRMLFFQAQPWVFTLCYTVFGFLVLMTFIIGPPRRGGMLRSSVSNDSK